MKYLIILLTLISFNSSGSESAPTDDGWTDIKSTVGLMLRGSYLQFTTRNNLYYLGAGAAASWYAFEHDDRVAALTASKEIKNIVNHIGDAGVFFNFPFAAMGTWYLGKKSKNSKLQRFAMEYAAAMYLALGESGLVSYIQIHKRPSSHNVSFWEKEFRGDSSWPSGHIMPYSTLFFKTLQFYGPAWSSIPLVFTLVSGLQRMQDGKHYLSDIVGAFFFTAFASEGVRKAANYSGNHEFYKKWLEHDVELGMLYYKKTWGPKISLTF
ncbi:MAG: undecaprenyl-diphosphatase [Bacteriovoracaceae bacterium]|jgi:undecaprenyl-diphosphatase